MTIQELDNVLEQCEKDRLLIKQKATDLAKVRAELLEAEEFDNKLAAMKPVKRQKFLKKLGKTDQEIVEIEAKLPKRNVQHVTANVADIGVLGTSN